MKCYAITFGLVLGFFASRAAAQNSYTWNTGSGTWDTTTANWKLNGSSSPWATNSDGNDIANFGGTGSAITVGSTVINVGTINFTTTGYSINSGTLNFGGSSPTISVGSGLSETIGSTIQGSSGLMISGGGTLTLSGSNTYSGGTMIGGGTLQFAKIASMPASGAVTVSSGATLAVNAGGSGEFTNGTSGNGSIGGLLGGLGAQSGGTISFQPGSSLGMDTSNAGLSLTYASNNTNSGVGLTNTRTGSLIQAGSNTFTLNPANIYWAGTKINILPLLVLSGTRESGVSFHLGSIYLDFFPSAAILILGILLSLGSRRYNMYRRFGNWHPARWVLALPGAAFFTPNPATAQTWSGAGSNANFSNGQNWSTGSAPASGATIIFNSAIANTWGNSASNPIVFDQSGVTLNTINFTGNAGNYFVGTTSGNPIFLNAGGYLEIDNLFTATNGRETVNVPLALTGAGANNTYAFANSSPNVAGAGAGTLVIGGDVFANYSLGSNFTLLLTGYNTNSNTISGTIYNGNSTLEIEKGGPGNWILSGTNFYTGGTAITLGTLQFAKIVSMPASGAVVVSRGATLAVNAGGTGEFTNSTSGYGSIGGLLIGQGGQSGGTVSFASGSILGIDTTNAGGSLTYAGNITNSGLGLIKLGSGSLTVSGTNTYTGGTTISTGTMQFVKIASMPASGAVTVSSGATLAVNAGGTGEFTNGTSGNGSIGGLFSGLGGQSGSTVSFASGSSLGIDTANAGGGSLSYAGNITNTGLGLVKLGTGSLVLTGANTYTGGTAINAGTLMANSSSGSSATGSGAVAVNSGGTLAGTGYAGAASTGTVTVNSGGTISPGNGTTGNLYLNGNLTYSGGTLQTTLYSTSSNSLLTVAGSTTISSGSITINFGGVTESQLEAAGSHQFTVLSGTISSGSFSGAVTSSSPGFNAGEWSVSADSGHVYLNFAPVPEPGTVILAGLLSLGSIGYGIRRRYRIGREAPAI